jgi:homoserine dehydrogenase
MTAPRTIGIGILGFGTVGQGVWKHLHEKQADLESRLGVMLDLRKASVRDLKKKRAVKIPASKLTTNVNEIIDDPKVHVVCELIGGTTKARELTLRALRLGKVVVSANKALLCEHGPEIMQAVRQHGGQFLFEASVAGGIPIIKAIREGLVANRFELIVGILNGTCNHILTRMGEDGLSFADALKEAQELGYAEADPTLDVDGIDAFHKASILAWLAHGKWAPSSRTLVEGIRKIGPADIDFARRFGFALKHLAVIRRDFKSNWMTVGVYPSLVPNRDILARVSGVNNGITLAVTSSAPPRSPAAARRRRHRFRRHRRHRRRHRRPHRRDPAGPFARRPRRPREGRPRPAHGLDRRDRLALLPAPLAARQGRRVRRHLPHLLEAQGVQSPASSSTSTPNQGRGTVTLSTYPVSERKMSAVLTELRRLKTVLEEPVVLRIFSPES